MLRRVNDVDFSNWLVVNADGGYCHGFPADDGETIECGAWRASVDKHESSVARWDCPGFMDTLQ